VLTATDLRTSKTAKIISYTTISLHFVVRQCAAVGLYSKITLFYFCCFRCAKLIAVNMCINCGFLTLIFVVFLLMSSPISCRSISTVNQTFNFLVVNLCLNLFRKVGLIAISLISFGNRNLHIYNRVR